MHAYHFLCRSLLVVGMKAYRMACVSGCLLALYYLFFFLQTVGETLKKRGGGRINSLIMFGCVLFPFFFFFDSWGGYLRASLFSFFFLALVQALYYSFIEFSFLSHLLLLLLLFCFIMRCNTAFFFPPFFLIYPPLYK